MRIPGMLCHAPLDGLLVLLDRIEALQRLQPDLVNIYNETIACKKVRPLIYNETIVCRSVRLLIYNATIACKRYAFSVLSTTP